MSWCTHKSHKLGLGGFDSHPRNYIFLSSNGRTSGFGPLNRSSNLWGKTKKQNKSNIGWISTIERELGSHRIATFTESTNAPSCHVGDPALCGHTSGNGEQTIE